MEPNKEVEPHCTRPRVPRIILPAYVPRTPVELERRRNAAEEILRIRAEIGPVDKSASDLIRKDRDSH